MSEIVQSLNRRQMGRNVIFSAVSQNVAVEHVCISSLHFNSCHLTVGSLVHVFVIVRPSSE